MINLTPSEAVSYGKKQIFEMLTLKMSIHRSGTSCTEFCFYQLLSSVSQGQMLGLSVDSFSSLECSVVWIPGWAAHMAFSLMGEH